MATIGKIRERSGLVIFIIGAAMVLFIVSDSLNSNQALFNDGPETSVGEIDGNEVDARYYEDLFDRYKLNAKNQRNTSELSRSEDIQVNNQTWESVIETRLLEQEYKSLGMLVTEKEMTDMALGENVHQYFSQIPAFMDDNRQYDRTKLKEFIDNFESVPVESQNAWNDLLEDVKNDRIKSKYFAMISKGIYMTNLEAKDDYIGQNKQSTIKYVRLKTSSLEDASYTVTEAEIEKYAAKNDMRYENDERSIQYVSFTVEPSAADSQITMTEVNRLVQEFASTTNDISFARLNSDGQLAEDKFYSIAEMGKSGLVSEEMAEEIFNAEIGYVFPVSKEMGTYKIIKVVAEEIQEFTKDDKGKDQPNFKSSFRASHILLKPDGETDADTTKAMEEAKKLMDRVKKGENYEDLAREFGTDGTKDAGGDLGWWEDGSMVKAFQKGVNTMTEGDLKVVKSRFGAHLIKCTHNPVTTRRKIAVIEKTVEASAETEAAVYSQAAGFWDKARTAQDYVDATLDMNLNVGLAENLKAMDATITGFTDARELVKWAFDQEAVDAVSDIKTIDNSYIIAMLTEIKVKGDLDIIGKETEIEAAIIREKKLDELEAKMNENYTEDINALAAALSVEVESASNVNFNTPLIANLGNELSVIGAVAALKDGKTSKVIRGNEGVYVVLLEASSDVEIPATFADYKAKQVKSKSTSARFEVVPAIKKTVTIEDRRYKFY